VLKGTTNGEDYPQIDSRWEGIEQKYTASLVNAEGLKDLEISGEGTIDGSGDEWLRNNPFRRGPGGPGRGPRPDAAATPGAPPAPAAPPVAPAAPAPAAVPAPAPAPAAAPPAPRPPFRGRPRLIGIQNSKRVHIAGLNLHNQAVWCLFILYSEDVVAENLRITAEHNIPSSDGIDIDSSRRVRVNNVYIDVNDDCISIKFGKDADGLRVNRPAEDIIIENSHFAYGHGGVAMGSETSGGIRNVEVRDCVADSDNWAPIRFKTQPSRGGVVENITYRNMKLHEVRQAFEFNLEWRMVQPIAPPAKVLPIVRNVHIINVSGDVKSVGVIHGLEGSPIRDIHFENCQITAQRGFRLEHARNVDLKGLKLEVAEGEPITKTDVE